MKRDARRRRDFLRVALGAAATVAVHRSSRAFPGTLEIGTGGFSSATESLDDLFAGLRLYFGDLHGHTGYSDGFGTPAQFYEYARDLQKLDFCAISDHAEWTNFFESRLSMADGSAMSLYPPLAVKRAMKVACQTPSLAPPWVTLRSGRPDSGHPHHRQPQRRLHRGMD